MCNMIQMLQRWHDERRLGSLALPSVNKAIGAKRVKNRHFGSTFTSVHGGVIAFPANHAHLGSKCRHLQASSS